MQIDTANKKRDIENPVRNETVEVAVLGEINLEGVSRSTVHRILKHNKWHPYKIQLFKELHEGDNDRRTRRTLNSSCKYEPSYGRNRSNSINKNDEDKSATSIIASKYGGGYSTNYQRDTGASRDLGRSENPRIKPLLDKKDTLHPPVSYRPISRTGARSRDPSPIDKSEKSSSSSSYNLSRLYPSRPYTRSVSRERTDSSNSTTTIPKFTGRAVSKDEVSKYSSRTKEEIPKYMGRTSIGKDEPLTRYKTSSKTTSREDLSVPQKYSNSRYKAAGRTTSREDLSNPQKYINSRFLPKNAIEKSHTAYVRPTNRTHEVSQRNKELLSVLQAQHEHERHSRPSSRCSSVTPDDHYQKDFLKAQAYKPQPKNVEMETVFVVTRGTSPTPTSTQTSFLRSRRTEVAKMVEKTITRPKIRPTMVDQEIQSDRLDDSTKSSRFAGASRISATPWSSFLDMKFSSPSTKQKSLKQNEQSSQNNFDKSDKTNCDSPKSISRASSSKSLSQGSSKSEGKTKEKKSPSPPFKSKLIPPKQVQTTDKKLLPPQIPNTNKNNSIHSQNIQNKDFRKSVLNMNPDKKKKLGRRSNSASSADSDHSVADAEATDVSENLATCKSYHPSMASRLPQKINDPRSRRSPSSDASTSSTSEDDIKNKFKGHLSAGSSRTSMILSSADELSQDKLPKLANLKIKDAKPETVEAKSFLMRALAPVTNLFKVKQVELPEKAVISDNNCSEKEESPEKTKPRLATLILTKVETSEKPLCYNESSGQFSHEPSSHSNSTNKSPKQLIRIDKNTGLPIKTFMRHVDSGDIPWWLDEKSEVPEGVETYPNWVREDGTTEDGKKIFKIRHNESDESSWWLDSSEKSKSDPNPANVTYVHEDGVTEDGKTIFKVRHNDSDESSWWVDSGDKSNSELRRLNTIDQEYLDQNNIRPIEDGVTEDGRVIYKIRHNDSDETSWWVDSSDKSNNNSQMHQDYQEKHKLRHIDSGERAWWMSSSENVSEMVQPQEEQENKSKYAIRHQDFDEKPWWLNNNEINQSDNESDSEIPLGDRASPEGLEMPKDEGRLSPYDNVPEQESRDKKRINMTLFISKHTNIDDILGGSGQLWSPVSDEMFRFNDTSQECTEIDARQVIIHEPSPRRGEMHSNRTDNFGGVSNAYPFRKEIPCPLPTTDLFQETLHRHTTIHVTDEYEIKSAGCTFLEHRNTDVKHSNVKYSFWSIESAGTLEQMSTEVLHTGKEGTVTEEFLVSFILSSSPTAKLYLRWR
ncbi:unnamed protein product [Brassicogethes aeneus]|uniref:Uncharacterized protein n=1 Tax=Brassicogethes aeneus TaxID=1431903 RepID=A0A9P0AR21_BRAAE|nr:unnamed protein product [Brassicogethes aeneus]